MTAASNNPPPRSSMPQPSSRPTPPRPSTASSAKRHRLHLSPSRLIPILGWLPHYARAWLTADIVAGLTTAAVVIPYAMAYAAVVGLPIEAGIYTVLVPMTVYAVLGSSRILSTSTTTTLGILTAAALGRVAPHGDSAALVTASATLACMVGAMLIAAAILRLGFVASFISDPVLTGFKAGIGLVIILDQVPKLLGIHYDRGNFLQNLLSLAEHLRDTFPPTVLVSLVMLLLLIFLRHRFPRIPAPLVAVALGIAGSWLLGFDKIGVATVGHIPAGLPAFRLPDLALVQALLPSAAGIALMSFTETIAAGRAFAGHDDPPVNANQEMLATGTAGLIGGLFGCMPAGGGTSQTAVNCLAGARTQLAALVTVVVAAAVLLFLSPLIALMPQATLATVVIVYSTGLIRPREMREIARIRRMEFFWTIVACIGVILFGTLEGILGAVLVSLLALVHQANHPKVYAIGRISGTDIFQALVPEHAPPAGISPPLHTVGPDGQLETDPCIEAGRGADEVFPGLLIVRVEGRIYFANAQVVADKISHLIREHDPKVVLFDMGAVPDVEYTAIKTLTDGAERLRLRGIDLWLSGLNPDVFDTMRRTSLFRQLGRKRIFLNRQEAVTYYMAQAVDAAGPSHEAETR